MIFHVPYTMIKFHCYIRLHKLINEDCKSKARAVTPLLKLYGILKSALWYIYRSSDLKDGVHYKRLFFRL